MRWLLVISASVLLAAAPAPETDLLRYHTLLDAYKAGDASKSVDELLQWSRSRIEQVIKLASTPKDTFFPWDVSRFGLAVMLHTDGALRITPYAESNEAFAHLELAANLLGRGMRLDAERVRPLAQRWYFTLARYLRHWNAPYIAERLLEMGRERLRDDPVILYESGTLAETLATEYALAPLIAMQTRRPNAMVTLSVTLQRRKGYLNNAATWLGQAAALDPKNELLRVHLGRVHALRFDDDQALRFLGEVRDKTADDAIAYLASVFIGGIHQRQRRLDEAMGAYRFAIARFPRGHAAYVGLSEVLQLSGNGDESRAVLRTLLSESSGATSEPQWMYAFEPNNIPDQRLEALRHEVRR